MAIYVYQGFWEDCLVNGGNVVWPSGGSAGNFSVILVQDNVNLDTTSGLVLPTARTWANLASQTAVTEMSTSGTGYSRFALNVSARSSNWDSGATPNELELKYDNANYPITWVDLAAGTTIGAYVIVRTVDGGNGDRVWMADSSATGLPAATNGEDFTVTLNAEAFLKGYQPAQPQV